MDIAELAAKLLIRDAKDGLTEVQAFMDKAGITGHTRAGVTFELRRAGYNIRRIGHRLMIIAYRLTD